MMTAKAVFGPDDQVVHRPVMMEKVLEKLQCRPGHLVLDATCGLGGHSEAILKATAPNGQLLAVDRDQSALDYCRQRLAPYLKRVRFLHENFKTLPLVLNNLGSKELDGILFDLGVSSLQLETEERGFAIRRDGPLDMRMDPRQKLTAGDLVNKMDEKNLADIISAYGEEPAARRIARFIVQRRKQAPIRTTGDLAAIVERASYRPGKGRPRRHVATRTFQALRIAVNSELEDLDVLLYDLADYLRPGARMVVISFHSLEDRIVKTVFRRLAGRCVCGRSGPLCVCERKEVVRLITPRPEPPEAEEIRFNPRSRSAKLRCIEKR